MQQDGLVKQLPPETEQAVARLVRENKVADDWTAIAFNRDGGEVLVSVGTAPDKPFLVFGVSADEWPDVEPWWTQGSLFPN